MKIFINYLIFLLLAMTKCTFPPLSNMDPSEIFKKNLTGIYVTESSKLILGNNSFTITQGGILNIVEHDYSITLTNTSNESVIFTYLFNLNDRVAVYKYNYAGDQGYVHIELVISKELKQLFMNSQTLFAQDNINHIENTYFRKKVIGSYSSLYTVFTASDSYVIHNFYVSPYSYIVVQDADYFYLKDYAGELLHFWFHKTLDDNRAEYILQPDKGNKSYKVIVRLGNNNEILVNEVKILTKIKEDAPLFIHNISSQMKTLNTKIEICHSTYFVLEGCKKLVFKDNTLVIPIIRGQSITVQFAYALGADEAIFTYRMPNGKICYLKVDLKNKWIFFYNEIAAIFY
ncbi:MAG: hypothetical protein ACRCTQ_05210 [Brevinemataceae bacterium]